MKTIKEIIDFVEQYGYECISDTYTSFLKLSLKCDKGHYYEAWWNAFQSGQRCPICSKNKKLTITDVRRMSRKYGYDILDNVYINTHHKYWFKCDKGHYFQKSWTNFKDGQRCPICHGGYRYNVQDIKKILLDEEYRLVKFYSKNKIEVECKNRHSYFTSLSNYKSGYRCKKCFHEKLKRERIAENNPAWKGGISCEPYCEQWLDQEYKESIKKRDGYMCLNPECNKVTNRLCIHHIDYNKKNCHPLNLITVCISCNAKANKNKRWHKLWYQTIIFRRNYGITNIC